MLDTVQVSLAFGAGVAAAFNPCGVAMLPAYVSYLLGRTGDDPPERRNSILHGLLVGALMTLGFLSIFGVAGILMGLIGRGLIRVIPWLTVLTAAVMVVMGALMLSGRHMPGINLPGLASRLQPDSARSRLSAIYVYGLAYAVASLGCALPLFLVLVSQSLMAGRVLDGLVTFASFSLGMGLVVTGLSVVTLVSRNWLSRQLPRWMPYVSRVAGLVIIGAGLYIGYYWLGGPAGLLKRL